MKLGVEVQILLKFSKANFLDPLELTTKFELLDNLGQEKWSLVASCLSTREDRSFSLFPNVKGRFFLR